MSNNLTNLLEIANERKEELDKEKRDILTAIDKPIYLAVGTDKGKEGYISYGR